MSNDWPTHAPATARPEHGTYKPGLGFYDSARNGWIKDPAKLTDSRPAPEIGESQRRQVAAWEGWTFQRNTELDGMLRLRDSNRPEDRANYERIATGGRRIQVSDYETALNQAKRDGREIVD